MLDQRSIAAKSVKHIRKRILISGGAGYVGRTLTRSLYRAHDLCVLDTMDFGPDRFRLTERQRFQLQPVNICDAAAVKKVAEDFRPDIIIHLAAIHFIPRCELDPGLATQTNVTGTVNLLAACPSPLPIRLCKQRCSLQPLGRFA